MKKFKILITVLLLICLCACSKQEEEPQPELTPAEISELAMDNFVKKLEAGNYVVDAKDYVKTTVLSPEVVYFRYHFVGPDDFAFMTSKGETFEGTLGEKAVEDITFVSTENAIRTAKMLLPNNWVTITNGNMFELFYNNVEKPLQFQSNEDYVKSTLVELAGYTERAMMLMHEVYMEFDEVDPTSVHFTAEIDDDLVARIYYDDLDLTLNFGVAESDPLIDAWLKEPVYPETRTAWTDSDLFYLNSVFLPGYGKEIPFPDFSSYAMIFDEEVFNNNEAIRLSDAHASEEDVENYKKTLLENGFVETKQTLDDGNEVTVYRKLLREKYKSYASVYPYYENGFVLEAERYYDTPEYTSLDQINEVLEKNGFMRLPETELISEWYGKDTAAERSESWLFFFDYDLSLLIPVECEDEDALHEYLDAYGKQLEAKGYKSSYSPDNGEGRFESENGVSLFRYFQNDDGRVMLEFRNEKEFSPGEAQQLIADAGLPEIELGDNFTCRDITTYHKMTRDFKGKLFLAVSKTFASEAEAEQFLDEYTAAMEEAGFVYWNPDSLGSLKNFAYYNEALDKYVGFDYFPSQNGAVVNFDFVSNT